MSPFRRRYDAKSASPSILVEPNTVRLDDDSTQRNIQDKSLRRGFDKLNSD
jgi:hypothetical protein